MRKNMFRGTGDFARPEGRLVRTELNRLTTIVLVQDVARCVSRHVHIPLIFRPVSFRLGTLKHRRGNPYLELKMANVSDTIHLASGVLVEPW
jgi:hypothetical protein